MNPEIEEATRACLYAIVDRFNTDDPFWGSFVPEPDSTVVGTDTFDVTISGRGVRIAVRGTMRIGPANQITPDLALGALRAGTADAPSRWHAVTCLVDVEGRFVTSNFRTAMEAAITDASYEEKL